MIFNWSQTHNINVIGMYTLNTYRIYLLVFLGRWQLGLIRVSVMVLESLLFKVIPNVLD